MCAAPLLEELVLVGGFSIYVSVLWRFEKLAWRTSSLEWGLYVIGIVQIFSRAVSRDSRETLMGRFCLMRHSLDCHEKNDLMSVAWAFSCHETLATFLWQDVWRDRTNCLISMHSTFLMRTSRDVFFGLSEDHETLKTISSDSHGTPMRTKNIRDALAYRMIIVRQSNSLYFSFIMLLLSSSFWPFSWNMPWDSHENLTRVSWDANETLVRFPRDEKIVRRKSHETQKWLVRFLVRKKKKLGLIRQNSTHWCTLLRLIVFDLNYTCACWWSLPEVVWFGGIRNSFWLGIVISSHLLTTGVRDHDIVLPVPSWGAACGIRYCLWIWKFV